MRTRRLSPSSADKLRQVLNKLETVSREGDKALHLMDTLNTTVTIPINSLYIKWSCFPSTL